MSDQLGITTDPDHYLICTQQTCRYYLIERPEPRIVIGDGLMSRLSAECECGLQPWRQRKGDRLPEFIAKLSLPGV
jgi:hypothetical protein